LPFPGKLTRTLLAAVMLMLAVFLLAACGSSSSSSSSSSESTTASEEPAESPESSSGETVAASSSGGACSTLWGPAAEVESKLAAGLSCPTSESFKVAVLGGLNCPYCSSWQKAVEGQLEELGAEVTLNLNANGSASQQASQMQQAISQKPDGIIVFPVSESAIVPSLIAAKSAGVPVEVSNSPPAAAAEDDIVGYTGPNNIEEGEIGANLLAKAMSNKGNVIAILGAPGTPPEVQRLEGFEAQLEKIAPEMKVLGTGVGNWEEGKSISATSSLLNRYGSEVEGIFAEDDTTAVGAAKATKSAGVEVPIVGVGGSSAGLEGVEDGSLYGTMYQSPYLDGAYAAVMLYNDLQEAEHEPVVHLPLPESTKANVAEFKPEW